MIQYTEGDFKEFIIRPNSSLSWRGNKIFFFMLFFVSFIIAISFAMVGMWMILPFAGLEMLLLGSALTYCYIKNSQCEIVKIDEKKKVTATGGAVVNENQVVTTPGDAVVTPETDIEVEEEPAKAFVFDPGVSLSTIVDIADSTIKSDIFALSSFPIGLLGLIIISK